MNSSRKSTTNWLSLILGVLVCFFAVNLQAAPYRASVDGSVVWDQATGLVWARCAIGQTWTGSTCNGKPEQFNFDAAQREAKKINEQGGIASFKDWKVPTLNQLASIRMCSNGFKEFMETLKQDDGMPLPRLCSDSIRPAIDIQIFPNTPADSYWSSSQERGGDINWAVDFGNALIHNNSSNESSLRLVRASELSGNKVALAFPTRLVGMNKSDFANQKAQNVSEFRAWSDRVSKETRYAAERIAKACARLYIGKPVKWTNVGAAFSGHGVVVGIGNGVASVKKTDNDFQYGQIYEKDCEMLN